MQGAGAPPVDHRVVHPACIVCGGDNDRGLRVSYRPTTDNAVEAVFACDRALQGYEGKLHGGVIAALLDGAMTHCLFALGRTTVTAELTVRYKQPVAVGALVTVRAWVERDLAPLYLLRASLVQDGVVKASASAKFMDSSC